MEILSPRYGVVRNARQLGELARAHRRCRNLTLDQVCAIGNFGMRFLSEFERGKDTAALGKVLTALETLGLDVVVRPRGTPSSDRDCTAGEP